MVMQMFCTCRSKLGALDLEKYQVPAFVLGAMSSLPWWSDEAGCPSAALKDDGVLAVPPGRIRSFLGPMYIYIYICMYIQFYICIYTPYRVRI